MDHELSFVKKPTLYLVHEELGDKVKSPNQKKTHEEGAYGDLGRLYQSMENYEEAEKWYRLSAEMNLNEGQQGLRALKGLLSRFKKLCGTFT
jgi:hypothetical protein